MACEWHERTKQAVLRALALAQESIRTREEGAPAGGFHYRLKIYSHPETGELVRGYRRLDHKIMYRTRGGKILFLSHDSSEADLLHAAGLRMRDGQRVSGSLALVPRTERRAMWREETKRKERILKSRDEK